MEAETNQQQTKRPRGRPVTGAARVHITIRLPRWLHDLISRVAEAAGTSKTKVIESALRDWLKKPENPQ